MVWHTCKKPTSNLASLAPQDDESFLTLLVAWYKRACSVWEGAKRPADLDVPLLMTQVRWGKLKQPHAPKPSTLPHRAVRKQAGGREAVASDP